MEIETNSAIHQKLDAFIRKYYKNQLVKGLIYGVGLSLGFFLLTNFLEYFGKFEITGRTILFWTFIAASIFVIGKYIAIPLFKLSNLGKVISHEQAATIIGDHFPDVKDKLLNTLQLKQMSSDQSLDQYALVQASLNQRIDQLRPVPFTSAIDISENKKYLAWLIVPIVVFGAVMFINSDIITGSTDRLLHHGKLYEKLAPFSFTIDNDSLDVVEKEDYTLVVKMEGVYVPDFTFFYLN